MPGGWVSGAEEAPDDAYEGRPDALPEADALLAPVATAPWFGVLLELFESVMRGLAGAWAGVF